MLKTINVKSRSKTEFIDITDELKAAVRESGVASGVCYIYVPHTTAGLTINEGADPSVKRDMLVFLNKEIPFEGDYHHMEGNSAAHIKSSLVGVSQSLLIDEGKLVLGTWQSIYFCEFDGPRHRRVVLKIV
ncbi:MAG: YjbQ family protein [Nitrospirae bacterium]|nr:MAG: YjbQ family protein [Nitrospirota bacterium]